VSAGNPQGRGWKFGRDSYSSKSEQKKIGTFVYSKNVFFGLSGVRLRERREVEERVSRLVWDVCVSVMGKDWRCCV
jgi:hypothetical protein